MKRKFPESTEAYLPGVIFIMTGIVFFPVIHWLTRQTITHDQLLHAFLVLLLSVVLMVYERRIPLSLSWKFTATSQNLLIFSYALLVTAIFTHINLVILASLCLSMGSFFWYMLGRAHRRLIVSGLGAFAVFTAIAVFLPVLDWPLRSLAGKWAAYGLSLVGQNVELGLVGGKSGPMLILVSNGQPFHVAAECNGFGMLGSTLLMATIILLYHRLPLFDRIGWFVMSGILGLLFNIIRIILIVLIAPHLAEKSYMLMHETVGILTTYGGLVLIYFLLVPGGGRGERVAGSQAG